jgi:hypothetical protein
LFVHVPVPACSVRPRVAEPVMVGRPTAIGTGRATIASGPLLAVAVWPGVVAVTCSAIVCPASPAAKV